MLKASIGQMLALTRNLSIFHSKLQLSTARKITLKEKTTAIDFASFAKYKKIHGHLMVPRTFSFPANEVYGPQSHRLGAHALYIKKCAREKPSLIAKKDVARLNKMKFAWNTIESKFNRLVKALLRYRSIYGTFLMHNDFVVPTEDRLWYRSMWGMNLGSIYLELRNNKEIPQSRLDRLKHLGIPLCLFTEQRVEQIIMAMKAYKELCDEGENDLFFVPNYLVIPEDNDNWPRATWGMKLGRITTGIVQDGHFAQYRDRFEALGLIFDESQIPPPLLMDDVRRLRGEDDDDDDDGEDDKNDDEEEENEKEKEGEEVNGVDDTGEAEISKSIPDVVKSDSDS